MESSLPGSRPSRPSGCGRHASSGIAAGALAVSYRGVERRIPGSRGRHRAIRCRLERLSGTSPRSSGPLVENGLRRARYSTVSRWAPLRESLAHGLVRHLSAICPLQYKLAINMFAVASRTRADFWATLRRDHSAWDTTGTSTSTNSSGTDASHERLCCEPQAGHRSFTPMRSGMPDASGSHAAGPKTSCSSFARRIDASAATRASASSSVSTSAYTGSCNAFR